jgi:predicted SnoaL-like aldol condensation-catalyzing enzyme
MQGNPTGNPTGDPTMNIKHFVSSVLLTTTIAIASCSAPSVQSEPQSAVQSEPQSQAVATPATADQLEANKQVVRSALQEVFVNKNLNAAEKYYGEPYIQNNPNIPDGREAMVKYFSQIFKSFPDYKPEIDLIIAEGDLVMVYLTWKGTHTGEPFLEVPAQGVEVVTKTSDVFRIKDGQIVEHWDVVDRTGMMTPLGLMTIKQTQ